jgi:hypothetical protein
MEQIVIIPEVFNYEEAETKIKLKFDSSLRNLSNILYKNITEGGVKSLNDFQRFHEELFPNCYRFMFITGLTFGDISFIFRINKKGKVNFYLQFVAGHELWQIIHPNVFKEKYPKFSKQQEGMQKNNSFVDIVELWNHLNDIIDILKKDYKDLL